MSAGSVVPSSGGHSLHFFVVNDLANVQCPAVPANLIRFRLVCLQNVCNSKRGFSAAPRLIVKPKSTRTKPLQRVLHVARGARAGVPLRRSQRAVFRFCGWRNCERIGRLASGLRSPLTYNLTGLLENGAESERPIRRSVRQTRGA